MICKQCGTVHDGSVNLPGSGWIELVLWLAYMVPGLIYSIWRRSKRKPTCRSCGGRELVPLYSPIGAKLVNEHYPGGIPPRAPPAKAGPLTGTAKVVDWVTRALVYGLMILMALTMLMLLVSLFFRR